METYLGFAFNKLKKKIKTFCPSSFSILFMRKGSCWNVRALKIRAQCLILKCVRFHLSVVSVVSVFNAKMCKPSSLCRTPMDVFRENFNITTTNRLKILTRNYFTYFRYFVMPGTCYTKLLWIMLVKLNWIYNRNCTGVFFWKYLTNYSENICLS